MRRWVWWLLPAVMFRWYFHQISKGLTTYKGESVKWVRLDDELLILRYPVDEWYKKRGESLPAARIGKQRMEPTAPSAAATEREER